LDKFGRNYALKVGTASGETLTITLPFTIEFDITRNTLTSANVCQIRLFNLSQKNRNLIRFNVSDYGQFRPITLTAGYGPLIGLPVIFKGNISAAWSVREGVNFITQIECYDGGFAFNNGQAANTFPSGTPRKVVLTELAKTLPQTALGAIGDYLGYLTRGNSYSGNSAEIISDLSGGGLFIDQGKVNVLQTNECIAGTSGTTTVDASAGLLGTPVLERTIIRFDMIFEPGLNVGHKVKLVSATEQNFNGDYKVIGVKHRGMISEAVCGSVITTGEFFYSKILSLVD